MSADPKGLREALEKQMEEQDEFLPSTIAREQGLVWLEGWFDLSAALTPATTPAEKIALPTNGQVADAMQDAWDEICDDAQAHPSDIYRVGRKTFFRLNHWAELTALRLRAALKAADPEPTPGAGISEAREAIARRLYEWSPCILEASIGTAGPGSFEYATWGQLDENVREIFRARADELATTPALSEPRHEAKLREALGVAKRAILKAAQDTLWCDDSPAETVVDRIDALIAEADGQRSLFEPEQRGIKVESPAKPADLLAHLKRIPMTEWVWQDAEMIFATLGAAANPVPAEGGEA